MTLRLLIVGAGDWANQHAREYAAIDGVTVVGAVETRSATLEAFLREHGIERGFATLDEALEWDGFDAASNVTPDAVHHSTTLALLRAGKHVLCEKPLAPNAPDAREMAEAARASGLVNLVNLRYRAVPALEAAHRLVADGAIGAVRHFEASYLQSWLMQHAWGDWRTDPRWLWRTSTSHGSTGVLGDVGIHVLDFATYAAGAMPVDVSWRLKTFDKAPGGRIDGYTLDASDGFVMHAELAGGAIGTISATRFAAGHHNDLRLRLYGERGGLEVRYEDSVSALRGCLDADPLTATWRELPTPPVASTWARFVGGVREGRDVAPDFAHGAALQALLDAAMVPS